MGAYTPVTKELWQQRARNTIVDPNLPPAVHLIAKPPLVTTVVYHFDEDYELRETVGVGQRMRIGWGSTVAAG